jgi:hypothetical protein
MADTRSPPTACGSPSAPPPRTSYDSNAATLAQQQQAWQQASDQVTAGLLALDDAEAAAAGDPDALAQIAVQRQQLLGQQAALQEQRLSVRLRSSSSTKPMRR